MTERVTRYRRSDVAGEKIYTRKYVTKTGRCNVGQGAAIQLMRECKDAEKLKAVVAMIHEMLEPTLHENDGARNKPSCATREEKTI